MILPHRRLDVAIKLVALLLLSVGLWLPLRNLSYAFAPSDPVEVSSPAELAVGGGYENRYVATRAVADTTRALQYVRYGVRYYYFPVQNTDGNLFVRSLVRPQGDGPFLLAGRLQRFDDVPFSSPVRDAYRQSLGEDIPRQAWAVLQDEGPEVYRAALLSYPLLVFMWLVAVYLLIRGIQGKPPLPGRGQARRPMPQTTPDER